MNFGIVVTCTEGGFQLFLDWRIEAKSKEEAIIRLKEDPPAFIPDFMYCEPFKIVTQSEITENYK